MSEYLRVRPRWPRVRPRWYRVWPQWAKVLWDMRTVTSIPVPTHKLSQEITNVSGFVMFHQTDNWIQFTAWQQNGRPTDWTFTAHVLHSSRSERGVYEISVRSMNIDDQPTDRPNGHNSATSHPIHFMFVQSWGFWGWQIEQHYSWVDQTQYGIQRSLWKAQLSESLQWLTEE